MPYRLKVTEEEVRQELTKMGFTGLSDDTVAAMRKDLLKLIKSDLRKLRQERRDETYTDSSNNLSPAAPDLTQPAPSKHLATSRKRHTKETCYSSLSASHSSEENDESTRESGYSEYEESTSCLSEAASISLGDVIPQKQISAEIQTERVKEELKTKSLREKSKEVDSSTLREPKMISKKKTKPVEKKGLPDYPSRPDPVRLYHYYKAHWDQYKVPGEDPRLKLRWAIRSKLFYAE